MSNEIDELILMVLRLLDKAKVNGDTPGVAELSNKLTVFAVKYSLQNEIEDLMREHIPSKSFQWMNDRDVSAIIRYLLSLRDNIAKTTDGMIGLDSVLHPEILRVAESRMASGHCADAVENAFKKVNNAVKAKVASKLQKKLDGVKLMQHVYSPENPILLVEDNLETQTNKDTQQGYMMMFAGAMSAIRNPKAHTVMEISYDDAMRKLIFASMLMYKLDASHLVESVQ